MNNRTNTDAENLAAIMAWSDEATADLAVVEVMQWRGTRDALIHRAVSGTRAERKALLARLEDFTARHHPEAMRTEAAMGSIMTTMALLHWLEGDEERAAAMLAVVPEGHRMAELLLQIMLVGVPPQQWAASFAALGEDECLAFAEQERKAGLGAAA